MELLIGTQTRDLIIWNRIARRARCKIINWNGTVLNVNLRNSDAQNVNVHCGAFAQNEKLRNAINNLNAANKRSAFAGLLILLCSLALLSSCRTIKVRDYEIEKERVQNEIRIVQVSDFHSNDFGENEEELIDKIKEARPDILLLTGDFFDPRMAGEKYFGNVETLLSGIEGLCPAFFVTGNHDFIDLEFAKKYALLENYGVKVLHDEAVALEYEQGVVIVAGIHDPYYDLGESVGRILRDDKKVYRARLKALSEKTQALVARYSDASVRGENGRLLFTMLLAHRPEYVKDYRQYDFDLIFSGHAHGGQWRFPPLINGLYAPGQGLFPRYAGGLYRLKNDAGTILIVSRGLSYQQPKIDRIFNNPELVFVRVVPIAARAQQTDDRQQESELSN